MSIYSLHVSNVSRASGSSSVASLSYITARRMRDERTGETYYGYGRRERVVMTATVLPEGAPREFGDMERLFNAAEAADKAANARPAKKIMVALPRELSGAQRREALDRFVREQFAADGYAAVYAIHEDKDGNNPHAHVLVANRQIDPKTGKWALKRRMAYKLDADGRRIPRIDPETGLQKTDKRGRKQWIRVSEYSNPLDTADKLNAIRKGWSDVCNALLPEDAHIDHRSLEEQGIDRLPTIHEGYAAREIEKRGGVSPLCEANRETRRLNRVIARIREQLRSVAASIVKLLTARTTSRRREHRNDNPVEPAPRLADVARQAREDAGQPARQPRRPVRKPEQQPERQEQRQERPVSLAAAAKEAKEASKQLKRERRREPEPEPALEWNPWDPTDPMNLGMGGSQGYGLGL